MVGLAEGGIIMARIYKHNKTWYIDYAAPNGKRTRVSLKTGDIVAARKIKLAIEAKLAAAKMLSMINRDIDTEVKPIKEDVTWIEKRWNELNHREKQAILFTQYKGKCGYCGREVRIPLKRDLKLQNRCVMDHKVPFSTGGSNNYHNLILSCNECNVKKLDQTDGEFGLDFLSARIKHKLQKNKSEKSGEPTQPANKDDD